MQPVMGGNRLETMSYRFHADINHPDIFEVWLGDISTRIEVCQGQHFRVRFQTRRRVGRGPDTWNHQIQIRHRDTPTSAWDAWHRVTGNSAHTMLQASTAFTNNDQQNVFHMPLDGGSHADPTNTLYHDSGGGLSGVIDWPTGGNFRVEPEWSLMLVEDALPGSQVQFRFIRANGDANEFADLSTPLINVVDRPEGPYDEAVATWLNDLGVGDFSAPATATEPAIVVGEMIEEPDALICVIPTGGGAVRRVVGEFPSVTVVSRDISYQVARDRAKAVEAALDQRSGERLGRPIARIQPETEIRYQGRDGSGRQGGRAVFSQSFTIYSRQGFIICN